MANDLVNHAHEIKSSCRLRGTLFEEILGWWICGDRGKETCVLEGGEAPCPSPYLKPCIPSIWPFLNYKQSSESFHVGEPEYLHMPTCHSTRTDASFVEDLTLCISPFGYWFVSFNIICNELVFGEFKRSGFRIFSLNHNSSVSPSFSIARSILNYVTKTSHSHKFL